MNTCTNVDRFTTRMLAGLVVTVTMAFGLLSYALGNIQIVA